jgi:hypothetical protein
LQSVDSPVINRGSNSYNSTAKDLAGNARIQNGVIDLGAYEIFRLGVLSAVPDLALTAVSIPVSIDVLANDDHESCAELLFDTVAGSGAKHGVVDIVTTATDTTLLYSPKSGYYGVDSLDYKIACLAGDVSQARVYILTLKPLSKVYKACPDAIVEMGFEPIVGVSYEWLDSDGFLMPETSNSITKVKDNSGSTQVFYAKPSWHGMEFPLYRVELRHAGDVVPDISDIRVTLCPSPARQVHLTAYLDSLPYATTTQWSTTSAYPVIYNAATGELNTSDFPAHGTFTFSYTRTTTCDVTSPAGKVYVHIANGKIPRRQDTVVICLEQAAAINISSIFGFDFKGDWSYGYPVNPDNIVSVNTTITALGAIIFDGQTASSTADTAYDLIYRNTPGKVFSFEYDYSGNNCIPGDKKKIVVVITN